MQTINELVGIVHENAKAKGWWESQRESGTIQMLIVSEIAEACEESRKGTPPIYVIGNNSELITDMNFIRDSLAKPEGELVELADAVIRIMDYCGHKNWNLEEAIKIKMKYNETRSHRHGGKNF
jgi:hypothetical protein